MSYEVDLERLRRAVAEGLSLRVINSLIVICSQTKTESGGEPGDFGTCFDSTALPVSAVDSILSDYTDPEL